MSAHPRAHFPLLTDILTSGFQLPTSGFCLALILKHMLGSFPQIPKFRGAVALPLPPSPAASQRQAWDFGAGRVDLPPSSGPKAPRLEC
jgi:hypothetical protein